MCKQATFSKYQKRAIKFLSDYLGADTPFSYERTQTNHLKVLIDGVAKPIFTGSTPSDCKSINNFMAEVKREVKASKLEGEDAQNITPKTQLPNSIKLSQDRLIQTCVKSLRARIDTMKSKEEEQVLETKSLNEVSEYRLSVIKHAVSLALQARKQGVYIKSKEMKTLESKILTHLDFMMPTLAYYAELLESKTKYQNNDAQSKATKESLTSNVIKLEGTAKPNSETEKGVVGEQPQPEVNLNKNKSHHKGGSASELMAMSLNNRVSLLRQLSKVEALQLIDDINQALAMNREQDIAEVVAMIKEKELPLEAIISRLEVA
ncbi:conserved hypothetical protein [Vibrio chagasii]|nr:conserved hypothetical protein [Vibrio chagasii]CAH7046368.1 conserved hypothetical protein [Vibrio chagasii]CAH7057219.1 conserved hypothetical protein [Vibrio chagasii]CAH7111866.1 conserved hypothetical protein [Vibrio chagasii]CAH7220137.1 conserved hypothetical protein [Vibrio chagasii]